MGNKSAPEQSEQLVGAAYSQHGKLRNKSCGIFKLRRKNTMKKTQKTYRRIKESDRHKIEVLYNKNVPVKEIANILGFSKVTIYAELKRGAYQHRSTNWTETVKYSAYKAQRKADYNATSKGAQLKIGNDYEFVTFVEKMILSGYSPEATLNYIKDNNIKFKTKICRVTLYSYIDKGIFANISNKNLLRKSKQHTKKKNIKRGKSLPKLEHSIELRPEFINDRSEFGHWELDTVIGKREKGKTLLVFTERKTRKELIYVSNDKTALSTVHVLNTIERKLGTRNFRRIFRSITCDNGTEFSNTHGMEYSPLNQRQRTILYYCHPYSSWERGSNENQNAFIRRFIPKGTPIEKYSLDEIKNIEEFINNYPRHKFGGKSSETLFQYELKKINIKNLNIF